MMIWFQSNCIRLLEELPEDAKGSTLNGICQQSRLKSTTKQTDHTVLLDNHLYNFRVRKIGCLRVAILGTQLGGLLGRFDDS